MERLQKVMAHAGVASRRQCEQLIERGEVRVNGQIVNQLGTKVDPIHDQIEVKGQLLTLESKRTYLFYKPRGVITSMTDPQGRKTVADFFREVPERVYPVGRLDLNTEGLLIMTNDGELANRLMHPRYKVNKQYLVRVKGLPTSETLERLRRGVELDDGWTYPAKVELNSLKGQTTLLRVAIREGRNRQIRRMCDVVGHPVISLRREKIGFFTLHGLEKGAYRDVSQQELAKLYRLVDITLK